MDRWNEVLERECVDALEAGAAGELDLSGTTHVDRDGFQTLQRLVGRGYRIIGENPLISEVRKSGGW